MSAKSARRFLDRWNAWVQVSDLAPMKRLAKTIMAKSDGILRSIATGLPNGVLEAINGNVQAAYSTFWRQRRSLREPRRRSVFRALSSATGPSSIQTRDDHHQDWPAGPCGATLCRPTTCARCGSLFPPRLSPALITFSPIAGSGSRAFREISLRRCAIECFTMTQETFRDLLLGGLDRSAELRARVVEDAAFSERRSAAARLAGGAARAHAPGLAGEPPLPRRGAILPDRPLRSERPQPARRGGAPARADDDERPAGLGPGDGRARHGAQRLVGEPRRRDGRGARREDGAGRRGNLRRGLSFWSAAPRTANARSTSDRPPRRGARQIDPPALHRHDA